MRISNNMSVRAPACLPQRSTGALCNKQTDQIKRKNKRNGCKTSFGLAVSLPRADSGGWCRDRKVLIITKDFKAYVQHLQTQFNSRNIACNGMRRLIVSHSKSTATYTPDEMIALLKTGKASFERLAK